MIITDKFTNVASNYKSIYFPLSSLIGINISIIFSLI